MGKEVLRQMGMEKAQAAEAVCARSSAGKFGNTDGGGVADNDGGHTPLPVERKPDLA